MKKLFEFFIPLLLCVMIIAPYAQAVAAPAPAPIVIDFGGVIGAVNSNANSTEHKLDETTSILEGAIGSIPKGIFDLLTASLKSSLHEFTASLLTLAALLISVNPDPMLMFDFWQAIVTVISCFYLLIFLIVGFRFLMIGANIQKREEAKDSLKNAVIMIIAVNLSFIFYQLILELATAVTQFMWVTGFEQFFMTTTYSGAGLFMLISLAGAVIVALITLFARYLFLLMGVVLFPIGIVLYLIPSFRSWGKIIFNFIGIVLAMQFIDVLLLAATAQVMVALAGTMGLEFVPALGFILISIVNSIAISYAIVKSAMSVMDNSPMLSMAVGTLTGQIGSLASKVKGDSK
jgi:hypothetical protein